MDLLARREHSRLELERKLARREFSPDLVAPVLDGLQSDGLLDDGRFAEAFVRSKTAKGKGPLKMLAELKARGVDESLARNALASAKVDWTALAVKVLTKRFGGGAIEDVRERARRQRFLAQRGFSAEQARAALERSADLRAADLDENL